MQVRVGLNASLRRYIPEGAEGSPFPLDVSAGVSALEILALLGIPPERAHVVTIDGQQVDSDTIVAEGQEVSYFPPLAGG